MKTSKVFKFAQQKYRSFLWKVYRKTRKSIVVKTEQGYFSLPLREDEPINRSLFIKKEYEKALVSQVISHLRQINKCQPKGVGTVVDVGANNGVISIGLLVEGEFKKAIAIEPESTNFGLLQKNVTLNNLESDITCLNYAVSDKKATLKVELSGTNSGDHRIRVENENSKPICQELYNESERQTVSVQSDSLEALIQNHNHSHNDISLIWVDVQGYEGYVFKGAQKLLSNDIPVAFEFWPYGIQRSGMSQKEFCDLASGIWTFYWVLRQNKFVRYPISTLEHLFDEIGYGRDFSNVIFTH